MKIPHNPDQPAADGPNPPPAPDLAPRSNQAAVEGSHYRDPKLSIGHITPKGCPEPPPVQPTPPRPALDEKTRRIMDGQDAPPEDPEKPGPAKEGPQPFDVPEIDLKDYQGPKNRLPRPFPLTKETAYGSLTDQAAATATANAWSLVALERQRWAHKNFGLKAPSLSGPDAKNLYGIQTDGPRGYLWCVCEKADLKVHLALGVPVWGTILEAPVSVVLQGDIQGMPGHGEFGDAAERIGRLIRFDDLSPDMKG